MWIINDEPLLSRNTRNLISEASKVYVSSASIWEIVIKKQLGKLEIDLEKISSAISKSYFLPLPITMTHTLAVAKLPNYHQDPFDRILLAQATSEPLKFLTADSKLKSYSELVVIA